MKQALRSSRPLFKSLAVLAMFSCAALSSAHAQTASATPDTVVVQITNTIPLPQPATPAASPSPAPTPVSLFRNSFAHDANGNGRFVVIESTGDVSTERTATRNNLDGNPEIFLFDYAQRRIFQITNTKSALADATKPPIDPATGSSANTEVAVRSLRPMLSRDGRYIVFSSNAYSDANLSLTPKDFDGTANAAALKADGNMEVFIYRIPGVADFDLSSGAEAPFTDLAAGTMTRVTFTPASRLPVPGTASSPPYVADDNREAFPNDDASFIAFVSTRNIGNVGGLSNTDGSTEVFIYNRTSPSFVQATSTGLTTPNTPSVVNQNPNLSGDGSVLVFYSNADIGGAEAASDRGNGEIYAASFNGTAVSNLRQLTRTPVSTVGDPSVVFSPGRRLSRNGQLVAFESLAEFNSNGSLNGALRGTRGSYFIRLTDNSFTQIAARTPSDQFEDVLRFPTFTGDGSAILFASTLNFRASNGEALAAASTDGLNGSADAARQRLTQIFAVPVPPAGSAPANYQRLTNSPVRFGGLQVFASDTLRRLSFTLSSTSSLFGVAELGGGNPDNSAEAFYLLAPQVASEAASGASVAFFTGASDRPVVAPSPAPTPPNVSGLAPAMLGIARSTGFTIAPSNREVDRNNADEANRRPPLPVELNGVSVTVGGYGAGLYFVSPGQMNFVAPPGLFAPAANTSYPVVINNNGSVLRTTLNLNPAQPDIFTSTNGAGGRAAVLNVTNACIAPTGEPFSVTTTRPKNNDCASSETETVPTELLIMLTGARGPANVPVTISEVTVRIKETDLTAATASNPNGVVSVGPSRTHGFDQIIVRLPAGLAGAGDSPVIVTVTRGGTAFTSRPADTAPRITIN